MADVAYLLEQGADVHARDKSGNTPLNSMANNYFNGIAASEEDELLITKMLVDHGADADAANVFGHTSLYRLADDNMNVHLGLVTLLIEQGSNASHRVHNGETPLHHAANTGTVKMMELLLTNGARVDLRDYAGRSVLQEVVYDPQAKYDLIFKYMQEVSIIQAIYYSQTEILDKLVEAGEDVETPHDYDHSGSGLVIVAKRDNLVMVNKLLDLQTNVNAQDDLGNTGLHYAAERGHDDVVWRLLEAGADVHLKNHQGYRALDLAVVQNKLRTVQIFKDVHPDLESASGAGGGEQASEGAPQGEGMAVESELSEEELKGLAKKQMYEQIQSPFHKLVVQGDLEIVAAFLAKGEIDVNAFDHLDSTALM